MRFLHLSDLHLGKRVCEFSMLDDQRYILEQILSLLDSTPVDGVLLAGDGGLEEGQKVHVQRAVLVGEGDGHRRAGEHRADVHPAALQQGRAVS